MLSSNLSDNQVFSIQGIEKIEEWAASELEVFVEEEEKTYRSAFDKKEDYEKVE